MKPNIRYFFIVISMSLLAGLMPHYSHGQNANPGTIDTLKLKATWKMDYATTWNNMSQVDKDRLLQVRDGVRTIIENQYKNRKLVFGDSQSFSQEDPNGRTITGTWNVNSTGTGLMIHVGTTDFQYDVELLTDSQLVISPIPSPGVGQMYFPKWYMIKE